MKIAVVSSDGANVDLHLGKGNSIFIYEYENDSLDLVEHRQIDIDVEGKHQGSKVIEACKDCDVLISLQYGFKSKIKAEDVGLKLVDDEGTIDEVLARYINHVNFMKDVKI